MTKTSYFNNGEPQIERSDGKMQPIIISDEDQICGKACWECFCAPTLDACGGEYHHAWISDIIFPAQSSHCTHHVCYISSTHIIYLRTFQRCPIAQVFQQSASHSKPRRSRRFLQGGKANGISNPFLQWQWRASTRSSTLSTPQLTLMMKISFFLEGLMLKLRPPKLRDLYLLDYSLPLK